MRLSALFTAIALITRMSAPSVATVERGASPSAQDIHQSLLFVPDRMAHQHVPGLSLACIDNGTVAWTQAFGVVRVGGEPVTAQTLFQASSISMPLTAVAVLRLVEQGKLNLDVDVSQYLRSWKLPTNKFTEQKKVTLRELLSHTAGATVHGFEGYAAGKEVPTLVQVLNGESPANSAPVTIDFVPGTKFLYAGGNYAIIQQILIDVTGESFPDSMQELVLQPLHMVHSTFQQPLPEKLQPLAATPYDRDGNAIEGGPHTHPEMAVAGLWTTPSDLALFALAIQDALAGKPGAILSPPTAHQMLQRVLGFYALGFAIAGDGPNRYFSHPGVNAGFVAFFFAYEKGDGVVLMTNGENTKALGLEIIGALAKQYGWTEFPTESPFSNPWIIGVIF
ncbi:MAG TPA: serine hydrolase domain-containing protein, partial [Ktedonobacteraceae bacterium]|nr:serine hydrolase domain-containing protein [Ktedonobacteraceae bacterium]